MSLGDAGDENDKKRRRTSWDPWTMGTVMSKKELSIHFNPRVLFPNCWDDGFETKGKGYSMGAPPFHGVRNDT